MKVALFFLGKLHFVIINFSLILPHLALKTETPDLFTVLQLVLYSYCPLENST